MEVEGFGSILSTLSMAKALYDIGRFDIVESAFHDILHYEEHYENLLNVITSIFSGYEGFYDEEYGTEIMEFKDAYISDYFTFAWEYGKANKLSYRDNPYVTQAQEEARKWLCVSTCTDYKLLAYTKTKRTARRSKLLVYVDNNCGCNALDNIAYGLIQLYAWFKDKCAEFATVTATSNVKTNDAHLTSAIINQQEVTAA